MPCEAFGIAKIEAPSSKAKRAKKAVHQRFKRPTKPLNNSAPAFNSRPTSSKKKNAKKKPVLRYKCGKPGHKAFQCKEEQKINELFADQAELRKKLLAILAQNSSDSDKEVDYYQSFEEEESDYDASSVKVINIITNRYQKEFLIDLIGKISNEEKKRGI